MLIKLAKYICILLFTVTLTACQLPGLSGSNPDENVVITGGGTSEADILAYIIAGMLEEYADIKPAVIPGLASSSLNHYAMVNGDANISASRFTGTAVTGELGLEAIRNPKLAEETVQKHFKEDFNQKWYPSYGYENTYAFLMRKDDAERLGIEKVSDLAEHAASLEVATDINWLNREGDGYEAFQEIYGFAFPNMTPMVLSLTYEALAGGDVDVILGYSTDAKILAYDLAIIEDDLQLFPPYETAFVASYDLLAEQPEIDDILQKLVGQIDEETMQSLNYQSDAYLLEPEAVARQFLESQDYFRNVNPSQGGA